MRMVPKRDKKTQEGICHQSWSVKAPCPQQDCSVNFPKPTTNNASHRRHLQQACHCKKHPTDTLKTVGVGLSWRSCHAQGGGRGSLPPQRLPSPGSRLQPALRSPQRLAAHLSNQHDKGKRNDDTHKSGNGCR